MACTAALMFAPQFANAQSEPDYGAAINLHNLFQKQCYDKMPHIDRIRDEAKVGQWVVGPLRNGKEVSWAVNEGSDNFSLMAYDNPANSSQVCEVRGSVSEETAVSVFNGIYADRINASRTGAPENSWTTPNGRVTIQPANDGRTSVILTK